MAPIFSKLSKIVSINGVSVASVMIMFYFMRSYRKAHQLEHERMLHRKKSSKSSSKKQEVYVNKTFIKQLVKLLKILVPSLVSAEMGYVLLVGCSLVARSLCDILMINNATLIESAIIGKQLKEFIRYLVVYAWTMPVISGVNNLLKLGINELKLRFRLQLTSYLYKLYMSDFIYYKMNNLDSRISNPDQLLTQDVEKFCNSVTDVYSNICKPVFDIFLYIYKLSTAIGVQAPLYMILYMFLSGAFLTFLRRPIGYMTMQEQKLEGEFRYVNSRLISHCEEVAFYRGDRREQLCVSSSFNDLFNHLKYFLEFKFSIGFIDNIIAKYLATMVGFLVLSQPFLSQFHSTHHKSYQGRIEEYGQSGKMLLKLSDAIGRLVLATREMTRLAGFTNRVTEFIEVLKQVKAGKYEKNCIQNIKTCGCLVLRDNVIEFDKVPLITPNGDILIKELNFRVQSGMNVLICGPNGCGKSSMFRILGELWPISGGTVIKPAQEKLFYIPQKPYMAIGTLRDQIIYPDVYQDMVVKGFTDNDLQRFLEIVQLTYILEREGGWSVEADWLDVLSGGEKQRIAMARLFYHQPQFAILDECTSAVSVDVEDCMYQYCKKVGITLFTVSHRKSLWKHHEFILQMDGQGSYKFQKIEQDTPVFGS